MLTSENFSIQIIIRSLILKQFRLPPFLLFLHFIMHFTKISISETINACFPVSAFPEASMLFATFGDSKLPISFLETPRLTTSMVSAEELGKCSVREPSATLHQRPSRSLGIVANIFLTTLDLALMRCVIPQFRRFSDDSVYARILATVMISVEEIPTRVLHKPVLYFRRVAVNVTLTNNIETLMLPTLW
jgi:hypothetical protein